MEILSIRNTLELVSILYTTIRKWAIGRGYQCPSVEYLSRVPVVVRKLEDAEGRYVVGFKLIEIQTEKRCLGDIMSVYAHELGHAIQHYNICGFHTMYCSESKSRTYNRNRFEIEAKELAWMCGDKLYWEDMYSKKKYIRPEFKWLRIKYKLSIPKKYVISGGNEWWRNKDFKHNRNKWWL